MTIIIVISGCGKEESVQKKSPAGKTGSIGIPENLEQYLDKPLDELSMAVGTEPTADYWNVNEQGFPENGNYSFTGDFLLYGGLSVDYLLADTVDDSTLYVTGITVELPYANKPGIKDGDNAETVKKKIKDAGLDFEENDEYIAFIDGDYRYSITMRNDSADQISMTLAQEKVYDKKFKEYCDAFPGGYYLGNGDYIVAIPKGLLQIFKNQPAYILRDEKPNGKLEMTDGGLIFSLSESIYKFKINEENGELIAISDNVLPIEGPNNTVKPAQQNPILTKFKDEVRIYQEYALEKWGYSSKVFYDVADFNNDGTLELYSILDMSSPTPGTLRQSRLEILTIKDGEVRFLDSSTATEPMLQGGTDFYNYYKGSIPGEGDYFIIDHVNTRLGTGHSIHVGRITGTYQFEEIDSVEFSYPNMDLANGELITDFPRAAELLAKYGVCYDNLLIGLGPDYRLLFGYGYNQGGSSYDYLQQYISGEKDSEIIFKMTGEWPE